MYGNEVATAVANPAARLPTIKPTPLASLTKIGIPVSINVCSIGNCVTNAPIPAARIPNPTINVDNAANAVTPITAKGATIDTLISKSVITVIKSVNNLALADAFLIYCIPAKTSTNAIIGITIAPNAAIPRAINPPVAAINTPIIDNGINNNVITVAKLVNIFAFSVAFDIYCIAHNNAANAPKGIIILVSINTPKRASLPNGPIKLSIPRDAVTANNNTDNDVAVSNTLFTSSLDSIYSIPAINPTATVITIKEPTAPFADPAALAIRANMPINVDNAAVLAANLAVSINDRAATAAVITAIAIAITIKFPLHSEASLVATIINAINDDKYPTAIIPLANPFRSIILSNIATPANIPIETDIANIVPAILGASLPTILTTAIRTPTIAVSPIRPTAALPMSVHSIPAMSFAVMVSNSIAPDIPSSVDPSLSRFFPGIIDIVINIAMNPINPARPTAALPISVHSIPAIILATITRATKAIDILSNIEPILLMFLPGIIEMVISKAMKPVSPNKPTTALPISAHSIPAMSFDIQTKSSNETDNFISITPALSMF